MWAHLTMWRGRPVCSRVCCMSCRLQWLLYSPCPGPRRCSMSGHTHTKRMNKVRTGKRNRCVRPLLYWVSPRGWILSPCCSAREAPTEVRWAPSLRRLQIPPLVCRGHTQRGPSLLENRERTITKRKKFLKCFATARRPKNTRKIATEKFYQLAETRHGHILSTSNSQHGPRKYVTSLRRTRNRRGSASASKKGLFMSAGRSSFDLWRGNSWRFRHPSSASHLPTHVLHPSWAHCVIHRLSRLPSAERNCSVENRRVLMNTQVFSFCAPCGEYWRGGETKKAPLQFKPSQC